MKNKTHDDPAFDAEQHDDDVDFSDADLGNDGALDGEMNARDEEEAEEEKEEAEEEEAEEEEEEAEEEEEEDLAEANRRLAKKLSRAGAAREKLEEQLRQAREENERYRESQSSASKKKTDALAEELDTLYEEVEEHRARGRVREASKAQRRIDEIRGEMTRGQAAAVALREAERLSDTRLYNSMVAELEVADPRFHKGAEEHDPELVEEVTDLIDAFEHRGMSASDALRRAVKTATRTDPWTAKKKEIVRKPEKRKTDVAKNIKASKKQPPDEPGATRERSTELPDMETISEADFDKLPDSVIQRLLNEER